MNSVVRETRTTLGLSMEQLGRLMGVSPTSVASLERNESLGTAKVRTIRQALEAMGKTLSLEVVDGGSPGRVAHAEARARRITDSVVSTMSLEGQDITPEGLDRLYARALRTEMDKL